MFISRNLTYIFLGRVFFCLFLEHDPKPFPFGCACPTEGYFLMGPRPGSVRQWSGQGREGQGVPSSPKNHPRPISQTSSCPSSLLPKPPATAAVAVSGRAGLRKAWEGKWLATCLASRSHVDAHHPVSSLQARTGGEIGGILPSAPLPTFTCFAI